MIRPTSGKIAASAARYASTLKATKATLRDKVRRSTPARDRESMPSPSAGRAACLADHLSSEDQVMPGTLMYECCLHTLRVFLLRLGWLEDGTIVAGAATAEAGV